MKDKERIIRILEHYINVIKKSDVQTMYGSGSKIAITNLDYSITSKSLYIEAKIILGDEINESLLDRYLADVLITDAVSYLYNDIPVKVSVNFDV